jgi:hypothetical protein
MKAAHLVAQSPDERLAQAQPVDRLEPVDLLVW